MEILNIDSNSIARELELRPGDELVSINGHPIRDALDYRFYNAGEELELLIERDGRKAIYEIEKEYHQDLGLVLEDMKMRKCGNKCIFCFVHQTRKGLRRSLYFKDEDYRFSFLYGHYVTLSNTRQEDLERIVEQRLSPLYISVHATEPELRKYLLGIKYDDRLLEKIEFLTGNGIELHAQIVLCPQLNDSAHLERTISDLKRFYPNVASVAIVPVGLTRHRKNLPVIKPVTHEYGLQLIKETKARRRRLKDELGSSFVYLSDEFYIRTGLPLPGNDYYEGFYQLENGVGLTRDFINQFHEELPGLIGRAPGVNLTLVSGTLGSRVLDQYILPQLGQVPNLEFRLHPVVNHFWGEGITVAGLLVGEDIYQALKDRELGDYVVLPPRVLNHDRLFLDDWTVEDLEQKLKCRIIVFPGSFNRLFDEIENQNPALTGVNTGRIRHSGPSPYVAESMKGDR